MKRFLLSLSLSLLFSIAIYGDSRSGTKSLSVDQAKACAELTSHIDTTFQLAIFLGDSDVSGRRELSRRLIDDLFDTISAIRKAELLIPDELYDFDKANFYDRLYKIYFAVPDRFRQLTGSNDFSQLMSAVAIDSISLFEACKESSGTGVQN